MESSDNLGPERRGAVGGALRVVWMWALPATFVCVLLIVAQPRWTFGAIDLALAVVVVSASFARVADVEWYGGETAEGDPATRADAARYVSWLVGCSVVAWVLAQSVVL